MGSPLPLERFAEIRADIEGGRRRDEALALAGISSTQWLETQREWLERMGAELELGRTELSSRYSKAFIERQNELAAMRAAVPAAQPLAPQPTPPPAVRSSRPPPLGSAPPPALGSAPPPKPASFPLPPGLAPVAPQPVVVSSPVPASLNMTLDGTFVPPKRALPFEGGAGTAKRPSAPPPPAGASAPVAEPHPSLGQTLSTANKHAAAPVLPFREGADGAAPKAAAAGAKPPAESPSLGSTVMVSPAEHAALRAKLATPFGAATAKARAAGGSGPPTARLPASEPPPAAKAGATVALDLSQTPAGPTLPFEDQDDEAKPAAQARPRPAAGAPAVPVLTLEQYSSLLEDLLDGGSEADVLTRYRLSRTQHDALNAHWTKRLLKEPGLAAKVAQARAAYRAWKQQQGKRP